MLRKVVFLFACLFFCRSYSAPHIQPRSVAAGLLHELNQLLTQQASHGEVELESSDDRTPPQQAAKEEDEFFKQVDIETDTTPHQPPTAGIIVPTTPSDRIIDFADSELPPDTAVGNGGRDRVCINTYDFQTLADILKEVVDDVATSVTSPDALRHIINLADLSDSMNRNTIGSYHCMNTYEFQAFVNVLRELLDMVDAPGIASVIDHIDLFENSTTSQ